MDEETVVVDAPKETLWNLLNDFPKLAKMRPLAEDLYGNHVYEKSFKYVLLALGDEIDYRIISVSYTHLNQRFVLVVFCEF